MNCPRPALSFHSLPPPLLTLIAAAPLLSPAWARPVPRHTRAQRRCSQRRVARALCEARRRGGAREARRDGVGDRRRWLSRRERTGAGGARRGELTVRVPFPTLRQDHFPSAALRWLQEGSTQGLRTSQVISLPSPISPWFELGLGRCIGCSYFKLHRLGHGGLRRGCGV